MSKLGEIARVLLGISGYQHPAREIGAMSERSVEAIREAIGGGQLAPLPVTQTRWYLADLETAQAKADTGDLTMAARLWSSMRSDGTAIGLRRTLTDGLVRLPRRFYGDSELVSDLQKGNATRSAFEDMFPPAELALLVDDGYGLGVGVGELVDVPDRELPVFVRLEPEFLQYRWVDNTWWYRSIAGLLPVVPGDGRWILHLPGGRVNPWRNGVWRAVGRSYINKEHAMLHRANYSSKLANPARVAKAPPGATEPQREGFMSRIMAWGLNTVFEMPLGWEVELIESNGKGYEVFADEISKSDEEMTIAIAGQLVTTTGGTGFGNNDLFRTIRADIIQTLGDSLAFTLNTQGLPRYTLIKRGIAAVRSGGVTCEYLTKAPKDHETEARTLQTFSNGVAQARAALTPYKKTLQIDELTTRYGIPTRDMTPAEIEDAKAEQTQELSPTESAQKVEGAKTSAGDPGTSKQDQRERNPSENDE